MFAGSQWSMWAHEKPLASSTSTSTSCLQLLQNTMLRLFSLLFY